MKTSISLPGELIDQVKAFNASYKGKRRPIVVSQVCAQALRGELDDTGPKVDDIIITMLLQSCGDDQGNIDNRCMTAYKDACEYLFAKNLIQKVNSRTYKIDADAFWARVL